MLRPNPTRRAKLYERNFAGPIGHDTWIRARRCCLCNDLKPQTTPTQAAHVKARGMGGCNSSWRSLVPLCREHHQEQGAKGIARIYERYGLDLKRLAESLAVEHEAEAGVAA